VGDPITVLIVDDSATMRALIARQLETDPGIRVVGEAGDPLEARAAIKALNPDVVTLDIEMPNMSGLDFLERLMRLRPTPVVMVSTLTQRGAEATIQALELGAVDCVGKPAGVHAGEFAQLTEKVRIAARARVRDGTTPAPAVTDFPYAPAADVVAIGASTGGVEALLTVLRSFPTSCPPTVITQHMPANFTTSFAARMDRTCAPRVTEAVDGAPLLPGQVYLAPGGVAHLKVARSGAGLVCRLEEGEPVSGHRPSVDVLFKSVAQARPKRAVGVILTGMGRDGAEGLRQMRDGGAVTIGQDEATCVVFGMPRAAAELGGVERQLPLERIGPALLRAAARERAGVH
jgi:two-component system chemotaxis response regulator CheB